MINQKCYIYDTDQTYFGEFNQPSKFSQTKIYFMKTIKHKLQITLLIFFTASLFSTVFAQEYEYVPMPTKNAIWSNFEVWPSAPNPYNEMNKIYAFLMKTLL